MWNAKGTVLILILICAGFLPVYSPGTVRNIIQSPNDEGVAEVCDGTSLEGQTCISQGYVSGNLCCSPDCLTFDSTNRTLPLNEPPILNPIGDKSVNRNETLTFTILGTDPDGDTVTHSAQNLPSGATFNATTRIFSWTAGQIGASQVTFIVSDGELQDSETITVISRSTFDGWRVLPIRSEEEFNLGMIGGEATQHMHGIARSASNPDIIYTAHDVGQIWKSTDAGETWKNPLGKNLSLICGQSIEVDPVNPNIVFVIVAHVWNWLAEDYEGLYRSKDGGDTWEFVLPTETNFINSGYKHNIAYDPASTTPSGASRCYVAFPENGLYRSEASGDNWILVSSLAGHAILHAIKTHPTDGQAVYLASSQGLFISNSRGENLQPLGNLPAGEVSSVEINPQDPNVIYATVKGQGLYRSQDAGGIFSLLRSFDASRVFINPGYPDVIYLVGTSSNAVISHDGGDTWIENMETVPAPGLGRPGSGWLGKIVGALTGIVPNPNDPNEGVAFSRATFWKTTDGGHTFVDSSTLFTGFAWSSWNDGIAFDPFNPDRFATFNCDVGPVITNNASDYFYKRQDGREAWRWYTEGLIPFLGTHAGDFQPVPDSQIMVASIGLYRRTQLMRSTDAGRNWELVTQGSENIDKHLFIGFNTNDPNIVYAGDKISYDAGQTFSHVDFGSFNTYDPYIIGMCLSNPDTIYALDQDLYRIFRSDDRGVTWRLYAQPGWRFRRLDSQPTFAVDPVDCNKVYTLKNYDLAVFNGKVWRDTGVLALAGGSELKNFIRSVTVDPNNSSIIYAGMYAAGISNLWRSQDNGYTWEDISYNLPRCGVAAMAVNPHTGELLVGSPFGTWVFPSPDTKNNPLYDKAVSMPSCHDGLKNGDETGVDSGRSCL